MARTSISIPDDLRDALREVKERINISAVCTRALWAEHRKIKGLPEPPEPEIPSLNDIHLALLRLRQAGTCFNPSAVNPLREDYAYAPPVLCITQTVEVWHEGKMTNPASESVAASYIWDHSEWALYEAIEMAQRGDGKVYVEQDVVQLGADPRESTHLIPLWTRHADEGFSIEVWPCFTGEDKHSEKRNEA